MNHALVPLQAILSLVPVLEQEDGWQLISSIFALEQFVESFRTAVELFNFSAFEMQQARCERNLTDAASGFEVVGQGVWKEKRNRFGGWQHIAARDGALQIYHLRIVMEKVQRQLINVPTIHRLVDSPQLRTAVKLFQSYFPNWRLIRDAVAHSHNELAPSAGACRSEAPDEIDIPRLAKGREIFIVNALHGNKYIITKNKTVASYEISEATYAKLDSVRARFIAGFDNARAEVVKDWPKPPLSHRLNAP